MKNHRTLSMGISIVTAAMFLLTGCFAAQQDTEAMIAGKTVKTADTMSMEQEAVSYTHLTLPTKA